MYTNPKSRLNSPRSNRKNHNQRSNNQSRRYKRDQDHTATAGRELPSDNPVLTLDKPMKPNKKDQNGDCDKRRPKRFSKIPEAFSCTFYLQMVQRRRRIRSILVQVTSIAQTKELSDCNTNRGKRQRSPQPGQKGTF